MKPLRAAVMAAGALRIRRQPPSRALFQRPSKVSRGPYNVREAKADHGAGLWSDQACARISKSSASRSIRVNREWERASQAYNFKRLRGHKWPEKREVEFRDPLGEK